MQHIQELASTCRIATAHCAVLNSECAYTFHSPYTTDQGIVVPLHPPFRGTVQEMAKSSVGNKDIYVRIVKQRVVKETSDEHEDAAPAPSKLGIGVEGGFALEDDKYETISKHSVVVLELRDNNNNTNNKTVNVVLAELPYTDDTKSTFPEQVSQAVDAILNHAGVATQRDVKVWQLDQHEMIPVSKYANADLPFVDNGVTIDPNPATWKCQKSGDTENLWLNLSTGYIGGGRKNWDGSGGSNGALEHFEETGKQYPLVVKLGTITADLDTADCYSYAPDEDGPVKIPNLAELLEKRGIKVTNMQKTVKSTAELEVELNANYAFDAITEAGAKLVPASGPGLQGLQNLGNSCYMNSVVQLLLSGTVPELAKRYGTAPGTSLFQHGFLVNASSSPLDDLLCQTTKIASALTSGIFCKPLNDEEQDNDNTSTTTDPKYRLAPRMFKHVIGKDHVDFCTGHQQDAAQFLHYFLEKLDRAELGSELLKQQHAQKQNVASHLFQFSTTTRLVCSADRKIKYKNGAPETMWSLRIPMDKAEVIPSSPSSVEEENKTDVVTSPEQKRPKTDDDKPPVPSISFADCVQEWAADTQVDDLRWSHLQNATHAAGQRMRFANFPRYLLVQMQRYQLGPDWQPVKLVVKLDIPEEIDLNAYKNVGPVDGEDLVPEESSEETAAAPDPASAAPAVDEVALAQLMDMGFSLNSCKRALAAVGGSNVEAAMGWVFEHNTDPDFNDPLPDDGGAAAAAASDSGVDEGVVQTLVASLGCFAADQVRAALKETNGAADRAADWLFSHMDDLDAAIAGLSSKQGQNSSQSAPKMPLEDGDGKYTMVGMISHIGKHTGSGHYVAHLKKDGKWVIFNDEKVALSSEPPFQHAYMYLFQRTDTIGSPSSHYSRP